MLPKVHLTSHSRLSGSRWVITLSWLSGLWLAFLYSSVYSCHLFLISSASVSSISFLSFIVPIFGISNFLEEIYSLSHSIVSPYFFALINEEGFLISPCYSLELCIQVGIFFLFSFPFCFFSFFFFSLFYFFSFPFIFISWRLIALQYCSGFCHTLTWISHGLTCVPHPGPTSHLPLHPIPLGLPPL